MNINFETRGKGKPLLLVHGLGGSIQSWDVIAEELAANYKLIVVDLPGFGKSPPLAGKVTLQKIADALENFLKQNNLLGIDAVGSSMGGTLVLELVQRKNVLETVISLDPGGFWKGWERHFVYYSLKISIQLLRLTRPILPRLLKRPFMRKLLLSQLSSHPEKLNPHYIIKELHSYLQAKSFDQLLRDLAYGKKPEGLPKNALDKPLVIGWGCKDRVCFPRQAERANLAFPEANFHWFDDCGHFPQWDQKDETLRLIRSTIKK